MKVLVISRSAYQVFVEPCPFGHVVHCDIETWTPTTRRGLERDFLMFRQLYGLPLFASHYPEQGQKHQKFLSLFGFSAVGWVQDADGESCELWLAPALDQSKGQPNG